MNLKEKYTQHQTEFDETAWQQFVELKNENKAHKNNNQIHIMKIILLLSIIASSIVGINQYQSFKQADRVEQTSIPIQQNLPPQSADSNETSSIQHLAENIVEHKATVQQNKLTIEMEEAGSIDTNTTKTAQQKLELNPSKNQLANQSKLIYRETHKEKTEQNIQPQNSRKNTLKSSNTQTKQKLQTQLKKTVLASVKEQIYKTLPNKADQFTPNDVKQTKIKQPQNLGEHTDMLSLTNVVQPKEKLNSLANTKLQNNPSFPSNISLGKMINESSANLQKDFSVSPLTKINGVLNQASQHLAKPHQSNARDYKNTWRFGFNYTFLYINGTDSNGNLIKKKGYFFETDYRRKLNKILSVGAGFGFSRAENPKNLFSSEVDFEANINLHLRAYLFLLNQTNNRLFIKGGTGISHNERLLNQRHYTKFFYLGWSFEAAYERNIAENILIGIQAGVSSGNDGFTYTGLSLGYLFE